MTHVQNEIPCCLLLPTGGFRGAASMSLILNAFAVAYCGGQPPDPCDYDSTPLLRNYCHGSGQLSQLLTHPLSFLRLARSWYPRGNINKIQLGYKPLVPLSWKSFRKTICWHIIRREPVNSNASSLNLLP